MEKDIQKTIKNLEEQMKILGKENQNLKENIREVNEKLKESNTKSERAKFDAKVAFNYANDTRKRLAFIIPIGMLVGIICGIMLAVPNLIVNIIGASIIIGFAIISFIKSIGFVHGVK